MSKSAATGIASQGVSQILKATPNPPLSPNQEIIRAELTGSETCSAAGITVKAYAPVLVLCRELLAAGVDPDRAMHVYRGAMLSLRVRIGEAAELEINARGTALIPAARCAQPRPFVKMGGP
jgi:hypothetical protein